MINVQSVITEYLENSYIVEKSMNEDQTIQLVRSRIDDKLYICKLQDHYDINIYNKLKAGNIKGVPNIYEMMETEEGLLLIEEYIKGTSLTDTVAPNLSDKMLEEWICNIGCDICDILNVLHTMNPPIIHRDIKPDNIILSKDGLYFVDFNISREYTGENKRDTLIMGTKDFAAPEQFGFKESDIRTDIYAVGATLKYLFDKCNCKSEKLERVISKSMNFTPEKRYDSASDMKTALKSKGAFTIGSFRKFLPPGYRRGKLLNMLIATPVYAIFLYVMINFEMGDNPFTGSEGKLYNLFGAIFIIISFIVILVISCNYLGIQENILKQFKLWDKKRIIKIIAVIVIDITIIFCLFIVYVLIASVVFGAENITSS